MATLAIFRPRRIARWKYLLRHSGMLRAVTCAGPGDRRCKSGRIDFSLGVVLIVCKLMLRKRRGGGSRSAPSSYEGNRDVAPRTPLKSVYGPPVQGSSQSHERTRWYLESLQSLFYAQGLMASTRNLPEEPHCCERIGFFGIAPGGQ
jgi:hypothetical protein